MIVAGEGELALERLMAARFDRSCVARCTRYCLPPQRWCSREDRTGRSYPKISMRSPGRIASALTSSGIWTPGAASREGIGLHHYRAVAALTNATGAAIRSTGTHIGAANALPVVDEIEWLLERYHPEMLWIADDVFTIHHGWIEVFAAEMIAPQYPRSVRMHHPCGPHG